MAEAMPDAPGGEDAAVELCERALAHVRDRAEARAGGDIDAVADAVVGVTALTRFANNRIHQNVSETVTRVRVTVAVGGRVARASTTRTDDAGLEALAERALAAAALRPVDPDFAGFAPPAAVVPVAHWDDTTAGATAEQRADVVAAFVAAGRADDLAGSGRAGGAPADVTLEAHPGPAPADVAPEAGGSGGAAVGVRLEAAGYCSTRAVSRALVSSTGQRATARGTVAQVDGIHRASDRGGDPSDGYAQATSVALSDIDGAACGARAAAKARAGLHPVELPPGRYEVVFEPKAVAAALVFPALLGFNGKAHAEGTSFVHLGDRQWDEAIELWDDATDPRALGDPHDAEGTPKRRFDLVRAGVSVGLTHDRRSARLAGVEPTGHSVGTEAFGGYATDLFLGGGDHSPDQLVAGVERGLLVTDLWYNRVLDPKTQVVTGLTRNGLFLIEGGRVTRPVQNLRFTQSIVAGFGPGQVTGLGDDAQLVGNEGGGAMHVPSVWLAGWSFTGNARG